MNLENALLTDRAGTALDPWASDPSHHEPRTAQMDAEESVLSGNPVESFEDCPQVARQICIIKHPCPDCER